MKPDPKHTGTSRESRYLPLMEADPKFRLWFNSFKRRKTARNYARILTLAPHLSAQGTRKFAQMSGVF